MGKFTTAFSNIADTIGDLSSLDVVTFSGSVTLEKSDAPAAIPTSFDTVIKGALANAEVKILASTQMKIDGDIVTYYDENIDDTQIKAHIEAVQAGKESRQATINFVKEVLSDLKLLSDS